MAVNVTIESQKYLWNNCSLTWGNLPKPWSDATKANVTADVGENIILAEHQANSVLKPFGERLSMVELLAKSSKAKLEEDFVFEERCRSKSDFNRFFNNSVGFTDKSAEQAMFRRLFSESIKATESPNFRSKFKREVRETIKVAENYWDNIAFGLRILEQFIVDDDKKVNFIKPLQDYIFFKDNTQKLPVVNNAEVFSIGDVFSRKAKFFVWFVEDASVTDEYSDDVKYSRILDEHFDINDNETHKSKFRPLLVEFLGIQETYTDNISFNIHILENLAMSDVLSKCPVVDFDEQCNIIDGESNNIKPVFQESINVVEFIKTFRPIVRKFYESFGIEETPINSVKTLMREYFGMRDDIIRACEGVLSDIIIKSAPMTFDEFMDAIDSPPLYNKFVDFKVGEYEYKKAIVKLKLSTTARESMPSIIGCVMHVDIPDTIDKGTAKIVDVVSPTKVYFNRHYYNPPEVVVNLKGGNTVAGYVIPNIVSVDGIDETGRYFEVELLDVNKNRVAGTISWTSTGY